MDDPRYFWYITIYYVCVPHFNDLSALVGCWSSVSIRRIIYNFCKCVSIGLHDCCGYCEVLDPVNRFNHTSWVAFVTPTDRSKSVRNRCVIEVFGGVFVLSRCFLDFFCGCRGFCHRFESGLFHFPLTEPGVLECPLWFVTAYATALML